MAFWGAPIDNDRHEYLACKTAVEMQKRVHELGSNWQIDNENIINVRIGINTGNVVVGNIGGKNRFDYTVMGDNVNLASRLEGANKQYGTNIMINQNTYEKVKDEFVLRELDNIRVKGKVKPTKVYELIGLKGDAEAEKKLENLSDYFTGLQEYKLKNFEKAYEHFDLAFKKNLDENASYVYMVRCKYFIDNPVEGEWDGVFVMKTK
jgi:adenylate cyclase